MVELHGRILRYYNSMLSRPVLTTAPKAAVAALLLLFLLTACQQPKPQPPPSPKISFNENYDRELKVILDLAKQNKWEEAQTRANALYEKDPKNPMIERVHTWVIQSGQKYREQTLENTIRDIDSKNSVFNPTVESLLVEKKDRGLPASCHRPARRPVRAASRRLRGLIPQAANNTCRVSDSVITVGLFLYAYFMQCGRDSDRTLIRH